jgi:ABC-2 type transport system ATP-binding protein
MTALVFDAVTKRYGAVTAVDEVSFVVPEGGIVGFLGPNGAGKTTSLRMALNIIAPTSGRISLLGLPPGRAASMRVGFLPEERGLYRRMTALDSVVYFGRLKGMAKSQARQAGRLLLERLGLSAVLSRTVDSLSKGMAQKVQLAASLVNTPQLVLLDEPFSGLDPVNQAVLEEIIVDIARNGATVMFSTHVMQHAERLCDRLILLSAGRKIFEGSQLEARQQLPLSLSLVCRADPATLPGIESAVARSEAEGWTEWAISLKPGADPDDILEACFAQGIVLRRFERYRPSLHDIFVHLIGADQRRDAL